MDEVERGEVGGALVAGTKAGTKLSETEQTSGHATRLEPTESKRADSERHG
jgi:hypothetical protein